jgi:phosphoserine phosphatase
MTTEILLVRNGQTVWNVQGRPRGHAEVPLDEVGVTQAGAIAAHIAAGWSVPVVYHSPLKRARETAERIATATGASLTSHRGFIDVDFGAWEGRLPHDLDSHWGDAWRTWRIRPQDIVIPGGESLPDVQSRALSAMRQVCLAHLNQTLVVVSHETIIRLLILGMLGSSLEHFWHLEQDPGAINVITYDTQDFILAQMNLTFQT